MFDQLFEDGNGLKCFPNYACISIQKVEEMYSLEKKTKLAQLTNLQVVNAVALREQISQDLTNTAIEWLSKVSLVIRAKVGHIEHRLE